MKNFFYFDLDNLDNVFLEKVFGSIFDELDCGDVFFKFYSSDLKKSFFNKDSFYDNFPSVNFSVFDLGGRKIFGKEAVDRVVSMDVISDISSSDIGNVGFVSNDYDFYGSLLLVEKFFCGEMKKCFIYEKGRLNMPGVKSDISVLAINTKDRRDELKKELSSEISKLDIKYNGDNAVEIYSLLMRGGVDVKKYIGNNSLGSFLKKEGLNASKSKTKDEVVDMGI